MPHHTCAFIPPVQPLSRNKRQGFQFLEILEYIEGFDNDEFRHTPICINPLKADQFSETAGYCPLMGWIFYFLRSSKSRI